MNSVELICLHYLLLNPKLVISSTETADSFRMLLSTCSICPDMLSSLWGGKSRNEWRSSNKKWKKKKRPLRINQSCINFVSFMLLMHPLCSTMANAWLEQRLHMSQYFMFSWKPVEVIRKSPVGFLGTYCSSSVNCEESTGAKLGAQKLFIARYKSTWRLFFSQYYFSLYYLFHLLPCRIATKGARFKWDPPLLLILQRKGIWF